ncbi:hypothetical protein [Alcanivorax sp.]|uniref:hypothetical protein n=1 Tax=Alcanivorax sp. TaxID=1872427 RepID=UPI0025B7B3E2|nr:hypothetical protein [Alcanivorax sp.]
MKYVIEENTLYADDGTVLKKLSCPLSKTWDSLAPLWPVKTDAGFLAPAIESRFYSYGPDVVREIMQENDAPFEARRWCCSCDKAVINISGYTEAQVRALMEHDRDACIYCPIEHPSVKWIGGSGEGGFGCQDDQEIIRIRTLRQPQAIREALRAGRRLLVQLPELRGYLREEASPRRKVMSSIDELLAVEQSLTASRYDENNGGQLAAYVLPDSLEPGDRVALLDLLEEIAVYTGRDGGARATGAMAIWTGVDFDIDMSGFPQIVG